MLFTKGAVVYATNMRGSAPPMTTTLELVPLIQAYTSKSSTYSAVRDMREIHPQKRPVQWSWKTRPRRIWLPYAACRERLSCQFQHDIWGHFPAQLIHSVSFYNTVRYQLQHTLLSSRFPSLGGCIWFCCHGFDRFPWRSVDFRGSLFQRRRLGRN